MIVHAPRKRHVVTLLLERILHTNVLIKPIPSLVVLSVTHTAKVITTITQIDSNRLFRALENPFGIYVSTSDIGKAPDITEHFSERVWSFPKPP